MAHHPLMSVTSRANSSSEPDSNADSSSEEEPAMATNRARRQNAGSRMAQLLQIANAEDQHTAEADEDGYAEIFQEAADDREFEGDGGEDGDAYMSSSSEDDDQEDDEEQGEKDLRKQEQDQGPGKKRKNLSLFQQTMKLKKLKYAPVINSTLTTESPAGNVMQQATERKKKSERATWRPDAASIRSSTRKLAVANKEATHQRLQEQEKRRAKTLQMMEVAEARRKARKRTPLTQEQRLQRAAQIERENTTSVNRWEQVENQRMEERKARLAALKNRKLDGPVISFWSGPAQWVNDRLTQIGKVQLVQEVESKRKKVSATENNTGEAELPVQHSTTGDVPMPDAEQIVDGPVLDNPLLAPDQATASPDHPSPEHPERLERTSSNVEVVIQVLKPTAPLSVTSQNSNINAKSSETPSSTMAASLEHQYNTLPHQEAANREVVEAQAETLASVLSSSLPLISLNQTSSGYNPNNSFQAHPPSLFPSLSDILAPTAEAEGMSQNEDSVFNQPTIAITAARTLITLAAFTKLDSRSRRGEREVDEDQNASSRWGGARTSAAEKDREVLLRTWFTVPPDSEVDSIVPMLSNFTVEEKSLDPNPQDYRESLTSYDPLMPASGHPRHNTRYLTKRAAQCALTGHIAKYRDPMTGLPYANSCAYKSIRAVAQGKGIWSDKLQCWIGESEPAKGVPESVWYGKPVTIESKSQPTESSKVEKTQVGEPTGDSNATKT